MHKKKNKFEACLVKDLENTFCFKKNPKPRLWDA